MSESIELKPLTAKQQRFVEEYLVDFNATQAAVRSGYSQKTAYSIGWENLRKPEIAAAINSRLDDLAMTTEEVLLRLTEYARGDMSNFIGVNSEGEPTVNIPVDEEGNPIPGALALIKKLEIRKNTSTSKGGEEYTTTTTKFELQDQQSAMHKILQVRGSLKSQLDVISSDGSMSPEPLDFSQLTPEQRDQLAELSRAALGDER